jgi:hypothetical protein
MELSNRQSGFGCDPASSAETRASISGGRGCGGGGCGGHRAGRPRHPRTVRNSLTHTCGRALTCARLRVCACGWQWPISSYVPHFCHFHCFNLPNTSSLNCTTRAPLRIGDGSAWLVACALLRLLQSPSSRIFSRSTTTCSTYSSKT